MFKIKLHSRNTMKKRVIAFKSNNFACANEQPKKMFWEICYRPISQYTFQN